MSPAFWVEAQRHVCCVEFEILQLISLTVVSISAQALQLIVQFPSVLTNRNIPATECTGQPRLKTSPHIMFRQLAPTRLMHKGLQILPGIAAGRQHCCQHLLAALQPAEQHPLVPSALQ